MKIKSTLLTMLLCLSGTIVYAKNDGKQFFGENFGYSIECENCKLGQTYENWDTSGFELDYEDTTPIPLVSFWVTRSGDFEEAYLEWEEDGTVHRTDLSVKHKGLFWENEDGQGFYGKFGARWIGDGSKYYYFWAYDDGMSGFEAPAIALHPDCHNVIKVKFNETKTTTITFNFELKETYCGYPIYEDCNYYQTWKDGADIVLQLFKLHVRDLGDDPDDYYLTSKKVNLTTNDTYTEVIDFDYAVGKYAFMGIGSKGDTYNEPDGFYKDTGKFVNKKFNVSPNKISKAGDYEIKVSPKLTSAVGVLDMFGRNFQFDLNDGGSVEYQVRDGQWNNHTVSGNGTFGKTHFNYQYTDGVGIRIKPDAGKSIESATYLYEAGDGTDIHEYPLELEWNMDGGYYQIKKCSKGDDVIIYPSKTSDPANTRIDIDDGWMCTFKIRFKDGTDHIDTAARRQSGTDSPVYNLHGQQVRTPKHGVYITNGTKVVVR